MPNEVGVTNSYIVPVFNGSRYLPAFWASLMPHLTPNSELIIVDDASNENVEETIPALPSEIHLLKLRNDQSAGYATTVNRGMKIARGALIIHLNTDLILDAGVTNRFRDTMERRLDVGILGAKLIYPQTGTIQHLGIAFSRSSKFHFFQFMASQHPLACRSRVVQATTGAILCVRRALYNKIGPMDEDLYNCNEDVDYCFRARQCGLKSLVDAGAVAYHWESQSGYARFVREVENEATFWGKWHSHVIADADTYIEEALLFECDRRPDIADRHFDVVNLSKASSDLLVISVLRRHLPHVAFGADFDFRQLNNEHNNYWLPMILPYSLAFNARPFIYIVDCYTHLKENIHWFSKRREIVDDELIIDHLGNCRWTSELVGCRA